MQNIFGILICLFAYYFLNELLFGENMELNKSELKRLFDEILTNIDKMESSLVFNLYEDMDCYSMEAAFDDENIVICRENPAIICSDHIDYKVVLGLIKDEVKEFVKTNKEMLTKAKEVACGFVDGELYYIKKIRKPRIEKRTLTMDDLKDFDAGRLVMWISVYMKSEAKKKLNPPNFFNYESLTQDDLEKWKRILLDNFDYESYYR